MTEDVVVMELCEEEGRHPSEGRVRCSRFAHSDGYHFTAVGSVTFAWTDDEVNCVRYRREREASRG